MTVWPSLSYVLLLSLSSAAGSAQDLGNINVLLISIDSVRPDYLGCYGHGRPTSPYLDEFAERSVVFQRAYSTSNWTVPAHASLLTGCYAGTHGAVAPDNTLPIRENVPSLPERLRKQGYATRALVSSMMMCKQYGFGRGFDVYDDFSVLMLAEQATVAQGGRFDHLMAVLCNYTTDQAIRTLSQLAGDSKPFFFFVHYFDPHFVYVAVPPHGAKFVRPYQGTIDPRRIKEYRHQASSLTAADLRYLQDLYDADIANTDLQVGKLLAQVERLGLLRNTLVCIVSDHGQEFAEHGELTHGHTLFEELIRVVMLIRPPGGRFTHRRVSTPVSLVDLMPTVLELTGAGPSNMAEGISLRGIIEGRQAEQDIRRSCIVAESPSETAIVGRQYKLLSTRMKGDRCYDLSCDPGETKPMQDGDSPVIQALRIVAQKRESLVSKLSRSEDRRQPLPPDVVERLRGLGYVQ